MYVIPMTKYGAIRYALSASRPPIPLALGVDWEAGTEVVSLPDIGKMAYDYVGDPIYRDVNVHNVYCDLNPLLDEEDIAEESGTREFPYRSVERALQSILCVIRWGCCEVYQLKIRGKLQTGFDVGRTQVSCDYRLVITPWGDPDELTFDAASASWRNSILDVYYRDIHLTSDAPYWVIPMIFGGGVHCRCSVSYQGDFAPPDASSVNIFNYSRIAIDCQVDMALSQCTGGRVLFGLRGGMVYNSRVALSGSGLSMTGMSVSGYGQDLDVAIRRHDDVDTGSQANYINGILINYRGVRLSCDIRCRPSRWCRVRGISGGNYCLEDVTCIVDSASPDGIYISGVECSQVIGCTVKVTEVGIGVQDGTSQVWGVNVFLGYYGQMLSERINVEASLSEESVMHGNNDSSSQVYALQTSHPLRSCRASAQVSAVTHGVDNPNGHYPQATAYAVGILCNSGDLTIRDFESCSGSASATARSIPNTTSDMWSESEFSCGISIRDYCEPCRKITRSPNYIQDDCKKE